MAETAVVSYPIPMLKEGNYLSWAYRIELYLKKATLWGIVNNLPAQPTEEQEQEKEKVLAIIGLSLADEQLYHVRGKPWLADAGEV